MARNPQLLRESRFQLAIFFFKSGERIGVYSLSPFIAGATGGVSIRYGVVCTSFEDTSRDLLASEGSWAAYFHGGMGMGGGEAGFPPWARAAAFSPYGSPAPGVSDSKD